MVVLDKTGTLTVGRPELQTIVLVDGFLRSVPHCGASKRIC
jgi:cation transport ATPase